MNPVLRKLLHVLFLVVVIAALGPSVPLNAQSEQNPDEERRQQLRKLFQQYNSQELSLPDLHQKLEQWSPDELAAAARPLLTSDLKSLRSDLNADRLRKEVVPLLRKKLRNKRNRLLKRVRDESTYSDAPNARRIRKRVTHAAIELLTLFRKPLVFYMETESEHGTSFFRSVVLLQFFSRRNEDLPSPGRELLNVISTARDHVSTESIGRFPELQPHTEKNKDIVKMNERRGKKLSDREREMVRRVNLYREVFGLRKLIIHPKIVAAARKHARRMAENDQLTHASEQPSRNPVLNRLEEQGFHARTAGENVARGGNSTFAVLKGWIQSPDHHRNLLIESYRYIGVGLKDSFWALNMATAPRVEQERETTK